MGSETLINYIYLNKIYFLSKINQLINIKNRKLSEVSKKHLKLIAQKAIHFCLDGRDLSSREIFRKIQS